MNISSVIEYLEEIAPPALQESYDNAGLVVGSGDWECTGVLVSLDATLEVIEVQFIKRLLSRQLHSMTATAIYGKAGSPAARFRLSTPTPTRYIHGA